MSSKHTQRLADQVVQDGTQALVSLERVKENLKAMGLNNADDDMNIDRLIDELGYIVNFAVAASQNEVEGGLDRWEEPL